MKQYLGVDASLSATGLVLLSAKGNLTLAAYPNKWSKMNPDCTRDGTLTTDIRIDRLLYYKKVVRKVVNNHDVALAMIEDYAYGMKRSKAAAQQLFSVAELGGVIKTTIKEAGVTVDLAGIQELKKWASINKPTDVIKGHCKCWKCGGTMTGVLKGKKKAYSVLENSFKCSKCGNPYSVKNDVIKYVMSKFNNNVYNKTPPWHPLRFSSINMKKKRPPKKKYDRAYTKVTSDLCDAYCLAEMALYYDNKELASELSGDQLHVLGNLSIRGE
jgi:hypothetical protein